MKKTACQQRNFRYCYGWIDAAPSARKLACLQIEEINFLTLLAIQKKSQDIKGLSCKSHEVQF